MTPFWISFAVLLAVTNLSGALRPPIPIVSRQDDSPRTFSYDLSALTGPDNWFLLDPSYAACGSGTVQSPIDFPCPSDVDGEPLELDEDPIISTTKAKLELVGTTLNFELDCEEEGSCGKTEFGGTEFDLVNIHFHSPSEHHVGGVTYPLEAHMVHQSSEGALLVVSVMFSYGEEGDCITNAPSKKGRNRSLSKILSGLIRGKQEFVVDTGAFLEDDTSFCMYPGSLTTPPCTEGVTWILSETRQTVSPLEVRVFQALVGGSEFGNARPIQERNGRSIVFAPDVLAA
ncbi:caronic anhyrase [Gracilaria domingensis]|nr:caronic anhyrase [Gracilaria domingensis]